jgi:uncharacterized protein (UPF0276 family)
MSLVFGGADAPSARGSQPRSSDIAELPKSRAQVEAIGANLRNLEAQMALLLLLPNSSDSASNSRMTDHSGRLEAKTTAFLIS